MKNFRKAPSIHPIARLTNGSWKVLFLMVASIWVGENWGWSQERAVAPLPAGVRAVWDVGQAYRESTPTREKICLNGLWRWQPAAAPSDRAPLENWGHLKVPGSWPGITDYMQKDSQTVFPHPAWQNTRLANLSTAWYQREISIPQEWAGRRITLSVEYLNSWAAVFVDGIRRGEIQFPSGELDLTEHCRPGRVYLVSLQVSALPLRGVLLSYLDSNAGREVQGKVERRGLCGDVFLVSTPPGPRLVNVNVDTSVRRSEITINAILEGLGAERLYTVRGQIKQGGRIVKPWTSPPFRGRDLEGGRWAFTEKWKPDALWDVHTPQNQFELSLELLDDAERAVDQSLAVRFGYREFWIEGRDFFLNGTRLYLCAVPLDNAQVGAALASYAGAKESLERLKSIGINFVYTHNYGCEPGSHLSFTEILRAADDVGMLVSLSQPHFSHYDWKAAGADQTNGYARHAAFYARVAQNHPGVVAYGMSHNATGYNDDMNPDLIDGLQDPRDTWSRNNAKLALRAEAIVKGLDPTRIVYHHASGNLGSMHLSNFYPNFVPIQELSDWFEHWATRGVKPMFTCEYGAPFTWDWTMYRGWYKGERAFGSATVPWEFCLAEWNAQFLGDPAFQISEREAANLRWEARQLRAGKVWHRWDYPTDVGSSNLEERYPVFARYLAANWPAFRTWGVSAISPWEYGHYWKLRNGVEKRRRELPVDWDNLQRPGFSPDFLEQQYERMDLAFERADWVPTEAARALLRYNGPLLAYLGGKPGSFTSQDHLFVPGETVEKQLIVINNSRRTVAIECDWMSTLPPAVSGRQELLLATGEQRRIPMKWALPETMESGTYELRARVRFDKGETQTDAFAIEVVARPPVPRTNDRIALYDPKGETKVLMNRLGVRYREVEAAADLSGFDLVMIGKSALTVEGPGPDVTRVRDGLKVIMFEQTSAVLEKRFGFRVEEYGLRQVFPRVPDHPILAGWTDGQGRDWRGEATLLPPRLTYEMRSRQGPTVNWCDLPVTRLWRCGNRGNVASVLMEKPVRGDFLPLFDGGFSLQYSPLLEYREGRGLILFCQMDVTGRTEIEPMADRLVANLVRYAADWKPMPARTALYAGDAAGRRHLESAGFTLTPYSRDQLKAGPVLVIGPGSGRELAADQAAISEWMKGGGRLLALGFNQEKADATLPYRTEWVKAEHIATVFEPNRFDSVFRGIGPADVHNRDPREFSLIRSGATMLGNGVLASRQDGQSIFCQLIPWEYDPVKQPNLKKTFRRVSFVLTRLLANSGVPTSSPVLARFSAPVDSAKPEKRWLEGFYLDQPEEWDDPYRFFRW